MAGRTNHVTVIDEETAVALRARLEAEGFEMNEVAHATFGARGQGVNVVHYRSGKLVIQGKGTDDFLLGYLSAAIPEGAGPKLEHPTIGSDEAGKGDYFGPLTVAAVALEPDVVPFLDEVPLIDSKRLADRTVIEAAQALTPVVVHETVSIGPARYNEMLPSFRSLDRLLAWAHAKAIRSVLERSPIRRVFVDRFADRKVIEAALGDAAEGLELIIEPRGEQDPAVAAAAILARAAFLEGIQRCGRRAGRPLPKGAGEKVVAAAGALWAEGGEAALKEVAKLHFATTEQAVRRMGG